MNIDVLNEGILVEVFFFLLSVVSVDIDMFLIFVVDVVVFSIMIGVLICFFSEGIFLVDGMILVSDWLLDSIVWESLSLLVLVVGDGYGLYYNDGVVCYVV